MLCRFRFDGGQEHGRTIPLGESNPSAVCDHFSVVLIKPRNRGPRPVRCAGRHLGVAFGLSLSVMHMEANFVGFRHSLQARRSWQPQSLIKPQRCGNIGSEFRQAALERCGILDSLSGTLTHERQHRMAGVPQKRNRPTDQRANGLRSNKAHLYVSSAASMIERTCSCQPWNAARTSDTSPRSTHDSRSQRLLR